MALCVLMKAADYSRSVCSTLCVVSVLSLVYFQSKLKWFREKKTQNGRNRQYFKPASSNIVVVAL